MPVGPFAAMGVATAVAATSIVVGHPEETTNFIYLLGLGLFSLLIWQLRKIDKNQSLLFDRLRETEGDLNTLKGEHKAMMCRMENGNHKVSSV